MLELLLPQLRFTLSTGNGLEAAEADGIPCAVVVPAMFRRSHKSLFVEGTVFHVCAAVTELYCSVPQLFPASWRDRPRGICRIGGLSIVRFGKAIVQDDVEQGLMHADSAVVLDEPELAEARCGDFETEPSLLVDLSLSSG